MFAVLVKVDVLPDKIDEFIREIRVNAEASLRDEPGCTRFDVLAVEGSPTEFVFYELYADQAAFAEDHRSSAHYTRWRTAAAGVLAPDGQQTMLCRPLFEGAVRS